MRRIIALLLAVTLVGSVLTGSAMAALDTESEITFEEQAVGDGDQIMVSFNASADNTDGSDSEAVVILTYDDDGNETVAGVSDNVTVADNGTEQNVPVEVVEGGPGEMTAYLVDESETSSDYQAGDELSDATRNNAVDNDTATVYDASITLDSDDLEAGEIDEAELSSVRLLDGSGNDTSYTVQVHPSDSEGNIDAANYTGISAEVLNGSSENVTLEFDEDIESNETYFAMIHVGDDNSEAGADPPLTSYDSDSESLTALGAPTDSAATNSVGGDDGGLFFGGNSLPVIGGLPLLGDLTMLALGLIVLLIGAAVVGFGYYQKEMNAEYEHY